MNKELGYEDLVREIEAAPISWLPALFFLIVKRCVIAPVFRKGVMAKVCERESEPQYIKSVPAIEIDARPWIDMADRLYRASVSDTSCPEWNRLYSEFAALRETVYPKLPI